jgi:transcriptional regulator with XRE-family HTH domain
MKSMSESKKESRMFHYNLKKIRQSKQMSQRDIATYLSISPQSVSKWEKGTALPSIEYLPKLAECLGCDINAFFVPIPEKEEHRSMFNLSLLATFFDCVEAKTENSEAELAAFLQEHREIPAILEDLMVVLLKEKTITKWDLQTRFQYDESEATLFLDLFTAQKWIKKQDTQDTYIVQEENMRNYRYLIRTYQELTRKTQN